MEVNPARFGLLLCFRTAGPPSPMPMASLTDTYRTPHDEAYLYYGARNPLDPHHPTYCPWIYTVDTSNTLHFSARVLRGKARVIL